MSLLAGRVVLITGAGRGLGRAYALDAARNGALVVVNDVDGEAASAVVAEIRRAAGDAVVVAGSVTPWPDGSAVVDAAADVRGRLDGVVCNAGRFDVGHPWEEDGSGLAGMWAVNVEGVAAVAVRAMQHLGSGSAIVTVTSGAARGMSGMAAYGATKGAVVALTASWAIDLARRGVRVNAVSPVAETRMTAIGRRRLGDTGPQPDPRRVAPFVSFLLSPAAAGITGRVVRVDADGVSFVDPMAPGSVHPLSGTETAHEAGVIVGRLLGT